MEDRKALKNKILDLKKQITDLRAAGLPVASLKSQMYEAQADLKKLEAAAFSQKAKNSSDPRKAAAKAKIELGGLFDVAEFPVGEVDPAVIVGLLIDMKSRLADSALIERSRSAGLARLKARAVEVAERRAAANAARKRKREPSPSVA
jgi:hypothetical protein